MSLKVPKWKTAKNGAQYWCWFFDERADQSLSSATFYKTKNKVTLSVKFANVVGNASFSMNVLSFYLRKGKTLEVYHRSMHLSSEASLAARRAKKRKFVNVSNRPDIAIDLLSKELFRYVKYEKAKEMMGGASWLGDNSKISWTCSYLEAALRSMLQDNGTDLEMSTDYLPPRRLAGAIVEFRAPIIKIMRQDCMKVKIANIPKSMLTAASISTRLSGNDEKFNGLNLIPYICIDKASIDPLTMKLLIGCKDIKDVTQKFFGNRGKISTKLVAENFFKNNLVEVISEEEKREFQLTGKIKGGFPEKKSGSGYATIRSSVDCSFLNMAFVMKNVLSVDHLNSVMKKEGSTIGTGEFFDKINGEIGRILETEMFQAPRDIAYKQSLEGVHDALKIWKKLHKKYKRDKRVNVERIRDFFKMLGDSKKVHDVIEKSNMTHFFDAFNQWYVANGKVSLPDRPKTLNEIHDHVSREYRRLTNKDFELGLMNIEWVKPLHMLEYCDVKTRNHFMIYVAQTNHEIVEWGQKMGNCIGGYGARVRDAKGRQVLLAIYKNGEMTYNLEIYDKRIVQFYGKRNSEANENDKELFYKIFPHDTYSYTVNAAANAHWADAARYAFVGVNADVDAADVNNVFNLGVGEVG